MSSSNDPHDEPNMSQPEDRVVEEMWMELFKKGKWAKESSERITQMMAYSPSKKWSMIKRDMQAMDKARPRNKTLSGRVERANAMRPNRRPLAPLAAQPGGSSVIQRKSVPNSGATSSAASGAEHIPMILRPGGGRVPVGRRAVGRSMVAPNANKPLPPLPRPAEIEQELNAEGIQGDVSQNVGPLTQGVANLHLIEAGLNRSLAAGQAEINRRFNPPENRPPPEEPGSGDNVASLDELLQHDNLEDVLRNNAEARELITTAQGLREYWTSLTELWRDREIDLRAMEERIRQMKEVANNFPDDDYYPGQIAAEQIFRDEALLWFGEHRTVFRLLVIRFRELQAAAAALARQPEQRELPAPAEPELYTDAQDASQLDWYDDGNRGPRWWLVQALNDMRARMERHERRSEGFAQGVTDIQRQIVEANNRINERKARYERAPGDADTEILEACAAVMQDAGNGIDVEQRMDYESAVIRDRTDDAMAQMLRDNDRDRALIRSWNLSELYEEHYRIFEREAFRRYRTICYAIRQILNSIDNGQGWTQMELDHAYQLAWYLHGRENRIGDIYNILSTTVKRSDPSQYMIRYSQENAWDADAVRNLAVEELLTICHTEWENMMRFIAHLRTVAPHLDDDAPNFENNPPDYSPPPQYALPYVASSSFWTSDRIEQSKQILHTTYRGRDVHGNTNLEYTWGYQLRAFFGSPDIWRFFALRTAPYTKKEFFDLVNSLAKHTLPDEVLDAWLHFCTATGEFFSLGPVSAKVTVREKGWETKYENENGGMARMIDTYTLAKVGRPTQESDVPPEVRDTNWRRWRIQYVETVFLRCAEIGQGFRLNREKREETIDWLLEQINWHLERENLNEPPQEMWELEQYLNNWLVRGVFWMRQDRVVVGGNPGKVVRLDSGWQLQGRLARFLMFPGSSTPAFVAPVMGFFNLNPDDRKEFGRILRNVGGKGIYEDSLYRRLILREPPSDRNTNISRLLFSAHRRPEPVQGSKVPEDWGITRGTWHLFLRYLDDRREIHMQRDGWITW